MATINLESRFSNAIPEMHLPAPARSYVTGATKTRPSIVKPIALDCADLLRIRNGRGTRISVASGVLWLTEENSPKDHVLLPGDVIDLVQKGTAIVIAHRTARIVIEVPSGFAPPRAIEMVLADGERARRIELAVPTSTLLTTIATGIATVVGDALASIRTAMTTIAPHRDTADASIAKTDVSRRYSNGYLLRAMRRRAMHGGRKVERMATADWRM